MYTKKDQVNNKKVKKKNFLVQKIFRKNKCLYRNLKRGRTKFFFLTIILST